jgi:hypothetical protein
MNSLGYEIVSHHAADSLPGSEDPPYAENLEAGALNIESKLLRVQAGEPFEWPNMIALNETVVQLIGDAKRIVELGGGTGMFAYAAAANPGVHVTCSEFNEATIAWARENRHRSNIRYVNGPVTSADGPFDLLVTIEVIEHIADFRGFLETCAGLAPRAILSTPNKNRSGGAVPNGPPRYRSHVREWTAGELYWVLRAFYRRVRLRSMLDPFQSGSVPIRVTSRMTPLIALCEEPFVGARTP